MQHENRVQRWCHNAAKYRVDLPCPSARTVPKRRMPASVSPIGLSGLSRPRICSAVSPSGWSASRARRRCPRALRGLPLCAEAWALESGYGLALADTSVRNRSCRGLWSYCLRRPYRITSGSAAFHVGHGDT